MLSDNDEVLYSLDMNYGLDPVGDRSDFREMERYHSMGAKIY